MRAGHPKPRKDKPTRLVGGVCAACFAFSAAQAMAIAASDDAKPRVVCTTTMIADLARQIAGDAADVRGIMRTGEDPHIYKMRPRDVQLIAGARLLLLNGLHLESKLEHAIENNADDALVVRLANAPGIVPLESAKFRGAPDPHCWFNVGYFRIYAQRTRDALVQIDPSNADGYRQRATSYIAQLDELHQWVKAQIATIPRERRALVSSHDAFQYFGQTYDIDVYAVIGISTQQQPKPQDVTRLERTVRERHIRAVFVETSVSQTLNNIVKKVAKAAGATIGGTLYSDSLGPPEGPAGTYIGMVRHNVKTIVKALK